MSFNSRLLWLLIGLGAGAIIGYLVRWIQELIELRSVVRKTVGKIDKEPPNYIQNIGLALIIIIVAFASFRSQINSNDINDSQKQFKKISTCNEQFLGETLIALNARTTFSSEQAEANVNLQNSQANYLRAVTGKPQITRAQAIIELNAYIRALTTYLDIQKKQKVTVDDNPFPTKQEFNDCVNSKGKK